MKIENVARICLAAGWTAKEKRNLAIRLGVLREIVVDQEGVLLVVQKVFAHRASAVWRQVLERRRLRSGRGNDDGVLHRAVVFERLHDLSDRRLLLSDCYVDADDAFALLIDDRVDGNRGLSSLTVADDELALSAPDRNHRVDCFQSGLKRFFDRFAIDHAGRNALDRVIVRGLDVPSSIDRNSQRIDDSTDEVRSDRNGHDTARSPDHGALADGLIFAEEHDPDVVFFEVERQTGDVVRKLHQLAGHHAIESVHAGDPVAHRDDRPDFGDVDTFADPG